MKVNILAMDVLVMDEVSMISAETFEKVNILFKSVRTSSLLFGGVQVIAVLDPRQLPPVPDVIYVDLGQFAFQSTIWGQVLPHKVILQTVYCQDESVKVLMYCTCLNL